MPQQLTAQETRSILGPAARQLTDEERLDADFAAIGMSTLTEKQVAFVREYLIDLNASAACRRAGYSRKCVSVQGKQNMENPQIRAEIRKALTRRAKRLSVKADDVLRSLAEIANLDKTQAFHVRDGLLYVTDTDLLPPALRRCISEVAQTQYGIRIKFDDRVKALELLGRHLALFTDNLNLNDNRPKSVDEMNEEEIDAELARLEAEKASAGEETSAGEDEPA